MIERSQFTFERKKFEIRAMVIPAGIVAKAFSEDGQPASAPYVIPKEIIGNILAAKLSPSPSALTRRLMVSWGTVNLARFGRIFSLTRNAHLCKFNGLQECKCNRQGQNAFKMR